MSFGYLIDVQLYELPELHPVTPIVKLSVVEDATVVLVKIGVEPSKLVAMAEFVEVVVAVNDKDLGEIYTSSTKSRDVKLLDGS